MPTDLRTIVPRQTPGCDVRALPLTAQEGFVLSRVDGFTSASDIGAMTGLGDDVLATLQRLASLGALTDVPAAAPATATPTPPPVAPTATPASAAKTPAPPPAAKSPSPDDLATMLLYDPAELEEEVDLDLEKKKRVLGLFHRLSAMTHYEALGVDPTADKKVIKNAYYQLAPEFHPDKHFRKNLGSFKSKMEAVFKRLTEAQEVLSRNATRAEYDAYLEDQRRVEAIERLLRGEDEPPTSSPIAAPEVMEMRVPPTVPEPTAPLSETRIAVETPRAADSARRPEDDRLRRQALAAKLSSSRMPLPRAKPASGSMPVAEPAAPGLGARAAAEVLKKMHAQRSAGDHRAQVDRLILSGEQAAAKGDAVGAANAYRLASSMAPDDLALAAAQKTWTEKASEALAPTYLKQAEYEAKEARWPAAARSYERALAGMPNDARLLHLTAHALLQAEGDLHQAAEHAKRAVLLLPEKLAFRLTLAEIYLAANLPKNARREAEAAAKINAQDEAVRAMLKRIG